MINWENIIIYCIQNIFFFSRIKKKSSKIKEILVKDTKKSNLTNHLKVQIQQRQQLVHRIHWQN